MTAISLFSGMGGDSLGIADAGLELIGYSEKESIFRQTHDLNFDCKLIQDSKGGSDITKISDETFSEYYGVSLIFAGFPCQGFSNAGKKDVNDVRNTLFREFLRCVKLTRPKYIIGENVKGLLSRKDKDGNNYIDVILEEFQEAGYKVEYKLFKTEKYGIPQKRERLIIAGIRDDGEEPVINFPKEIKGVPNLKKIIKFDMSGAISITPDDFDMTSIPEECIITDMKNTETEQRPHPYLVLKAKMRGETYAGKTWHSLLSFGKRDSPIHCEIIDIRKPCKTVICTYGHQPRFFVPLRNKNGYFLRCLLPDELKQIQGFPADYKLSGSVAKQITQIGNAVPPPLIKQVVEALIN